MISHHGHHKLPKPEGMTEELWHLLRALFSQCSNTTPTIQDIKQALMRP